VTCVSHGRLTVRTYDGALGFSISHEDLSREAIQTPAAVRDLIADLTRMVTEVEMAQNAPRAVPPKTMTEAELLAEMLA